jgi:hypothetical protein
MFQTKDAQKIKTHILCSITFFFENCALLEIMWENMVKLDKTQLWTAMENLAPTWIRALDRSAHSELLH